MVGIVIVSHSQKLAEGAVELAKMMAADAPVAAAGGLEDGGLGTSFDRIMAAIEAVDAGDGVVVFMDMGSAVMTTEMVIEALGGSDLRMLDAPVVEGAVLAAVESQMGTSLDEIAAKIQQARDVKKLAEN
ncbi:dihydroxyacetone kinase phosphoryl donor subunit DhaM [Selenomonas sp.]|jgi:dihydroxyacetone kinase phosphotransfer subunit|uniref:dihydroxyacetone kinase phosphoryl donor subunit DhaM n=1 Tax=Selenomonas sp. TaxID=2053611 RepID=UPI0025EDC713|nr:dihydroxyacetone kinase phosphoryl donor subunit DhaM [Selenomonas sp.]MCI6285165.1 PTS-dependent dihydroxyacetone kinase phosphotransferase subunit DhaM [Selenomonas sp.]